MLCPSANDPAYKDFKKKQKRHPGVDVTQAKADAEENGTSEETEIKKAEATKKVAPSYSKKP